uniref:Secreted protein n=1 Tax=Steinernema glaseri TaxID=37863 RepID=A0A1I8AKA9_9BILA
MPWGSVVIVRMCKHAACITVHPFAATLRCSHRACQVGWQSLVVVCPSATERPLQSLALCALAVAVADAAAVHQHPSAPTMHPAHWQPHRLVTYLESASDGFHVLPSQQAKCSRDQLALLTQPCCNRGVLCDRARTL